MNFRGVHHIGIAVRDADAAAALFVREFGLTPECAERLEDRKLKVVWARAGDVRLEFLEPLPGEKTVSKFLGTGGSPIHHVCFDVADAEEATREAAAQGLKTVDAAARHGALGRLVNFIHPKSAGGVLVEFSSLPKRRGASAR